MGAAGVWVRHLPGCLSVETGVRRLVLERGAREMVNPALEWLAEMDAEGFRRWFKGSPVERTRRKRLLRNVAIAMGNSGEERFLPKLREWATGEDAVLAESAKWAAERIGKRAGNREE